MEGPWVSQFCPQAQTPKSYTFGEVVHHAHRPPCLPHACSRCHKLRPPAQLLQEDTPLGHQRLRDSGALSPQPKGGGRALPPNVLVSLLISTSFPGYWFKQDLATLRARSNPEFRAESNRFLGLNPQALSLSTHKLYPGDRCPKPIDRPASKQSTVNPASLLQYLHPRR